MPTHPTAKVVGGQKARAYLKHALNAQKSAVKTVEVGFFSTARYPSTYTGKGPRAGQKRTPVPVSNVAAWLEFGTSRGIKERPFFRTAIKTMDQPVLALLRQRIPHDKLYLDRRTAGLLGALVVRLVQESITHGKWAGNAKSTRIQKGSSKPLIDTGLLRSSVTYAIDGIEK